MSRQELETCQLDSPIGRNLTILNSAAPPWSSLDFYSSWTDHSLRFSSRDRCRLQTPRRDRFALCD